MIPDTEGRALAADLQERAQPGIEVRVMRGFCIDRHDDYVDVHVAFKHEEVSERVWLRGGHLVDAIPDFIEALDSLTHEVWAASLTLCPDQDTDVRERSYAIANAVDTGPAPITYEDMPIADIPPKVRACCGTLPHEPHKNCILR